MKQLPSDIRVQEVETSLQTYQFRSPLKFGGVSIADCQVLDVRVLVETRDGRTAWGSGSMPLGNVWSFPSRILSAAQTLNAMRALGELIAQQLPNADLVAHPVDLAHEREPHWYTLSQQLTQRLQLAEPIPPLCTLVAASPFDAAVHDAYGKVHGRHVYECYSADWMNADLAHYLDAQFRGEYLDRYTRLTPKPTMPLYHLVGALDPLSQSDLNKPLQDGLPNTLAEWIERDELTHLKIKLNGNDRSWDIERVLAVDRVANLTCPQRNPAWHYSLDFNEQCPNVEYLIAVLRLIQERSQEAFDRIAYVEQPTARDLRAHPENRMHEAAKLKPVVIDESLVDYESLLLARAQGYTGVALKACKGQSQALLMAAAAQKYGMFLCVQDLTCPGQSFLHSAGLAAHIDAVSAIEGNARQYCPQANRPWMEIYPGVFQVRNGQISTRELSKVGMGH